MRVRATEDAIVRLLRAGHPLPATSIHRDEDMRLPVFQTIEPVSVRDYGIDEQTRIVVGRARKEVWFVDIKRRSIPITVGDVEQFLSIMQRVGDAHPSQEVTGWMVTTNDFEADAALRLTEAACLYTARALKR